MSNMSYCRFENTYKDLGDCYDNWEEDISDSDSEEEYRKKLLGLCKSIVEGYDE